MKVIFKKDYLTKDGVIKGKVEVDVLDRIGKDCVKLGYCVAVEEPKKAVKRTTKKAN